MRVFCITLIAFIMTLSHPLYADYANVDKNSVVVVKPAVSTRSGYFKFTTIGKKEFDLIFFDTEISYFGQIVAKKYTTFKPPIIKYLENTPTVGCQTIATEFHSGGAHCCLSSIFAIACGNSDYLFDVPSGHSIDRKKVGEDLYFEDINEDGIKELRLYDEYFRYYSPEKDYGFSMAGSMSMIRYAVWTSEGWRVTMPGEFRKIYLKLMKETLEEKEAHYSSVPWAIKVAYYALMSGEDNSKTKTWLQNNLPNNRERKSYTNMDWSAITDTIFADIQNSVFSVPKGDYKDEDIIRIIPLKKISLPAKK